MLKAAGTSLLDSIVKKRDGRAATSWEKLSLEQRRKMEDQQHRELTHRNKPKSQEQLDFESSRTKDVEADYIDLDASSANLQLSPRPRPGSWVELRR